MLVFIFAPLPTPSLTVPDTHSTKTNFIGPSNAIQIGQIPGPSLHRGTVLTEQLGQFTKQSPLSISPNKALLEEMLTGLC